MFMYRTLLFRKNKIRKGRGRNVCVWECGVCVSCVRRVSCVLVVWAWEEGGGIYDT